MRTTTSNKRDLLFSLRKSFVKVVGIKAALLIGSTARHTDTLRSDLDFSLWVSDGFNVASFSDCIKKDLERFGVMKVLVVSVQSRVVIYFNHLPKLEFKYYYSLNEIDRNYLGSEIPENLITESIFYSETRDIFDTVLEHLLTATKNKGKCLEEGFKKRLIDQLIDKFVYEFEMASCEHFRSDAYQFYFFYNIALEALLQLASLAKTEGCEHYYLPKYGKELFKKDEQNDVLYLSGTLDLPQANDKKRNLLTFFYKVLDRLDIDAERKTDVREFLEMVYDRDYYWNFRDIAENNPYFKPGVLYRSANLTQYQDTDKLDSLLRKHNISVVVDLRDDREYDSNPYSEDTLRKFRLLRLPFDCYNQPEEFRAKYHYGTGIQIAYRLFAVQYRDLVKRLFNEVDPGKETALIHCFAGKDRTGCVIALLSMLVDTPLDIIYDDFRCSEIDTDIVNLDAYLEIIKDSGGVFEYLRNCGIADERIAYWRNCLKS